MKNFSVFVCSVLSLTSLTLPASAAKTQMSRTVVAAAPTPMPTELSPLSLEADLGTIASKIHSGILGKFEFPIDLSPDFAKNSFKAGFQTGFLYGPTDTHTWVVPVEGIITHDFDGTQSVRPYMGMGMGVAVLHMGSTKVDVPTVSYGGMTVGGGTLEANTASTHVLFTASLRPGLRFGERLYAELPFGVLGQDVLFVACMGMHL